MQLPRHGQLDDRRRRVLTEEVIGNAAPKAGEGSSADPASTPSRRRRSSHHARSYGDDVLTDYQPRVTDLVPQRYGVLALLFMAGLAAVAGLEAAHYWLPQLSRMTGGSRLIALDLASDAALANWFSSTTLALAAAAAMLIYSVRRHRKDDYHGRYRVWLWAAALWALMSIDEGASLHEGLSELAAHYSGDARAGGVLGWAVIYGLLFAGVGTRLFLEMRSCHLSSTSLLAAVGCFIAAIVAKTRLVPQLNGGYALMVEEGCEMLGDVFLLFAMAAHARYTILDAQGAIATKAKKAKSAKQEKPAETKKETPSKAQQAAPAKRSWFGRGAVDSAHNSPPAPNAKTLESSKSAGKAAPAKAAPRPASSDDAVGQTRTARKQQLAAEDEDYDYEDDRRLSKSERKAMRRQKDRHRGDE